MPNAGSNEISQAVFNTLLYSDVYDFPLTAREIHRYLSGRAASYEEVCQALKEDPRFTRAGDYFTLPGRQEIVSVREMREKRSQGLLPLALKYGKIIGRLPFIRMVALTGSLAVHNVSGFEDFDYMLVTRPGRLWTARAFVLLFGRFTRQAGHTICPNVIVSEESLTWSQHDLYSARDLCQMIPISGMSVYQKLIQANQWVEDFLPNAYLNITDMFFEERESDKTWLRSVLELPLRGRLGERVEGWEMRRKIERFSRQEGFGEETIFSASICQGNFDHHRRWTRSELERRRAAFNDQPFSQENPVQLETL
ncbi:MAG: hypothetical protein ACM3XO_23245 [Bacteroidota bacterium]